MALPRVFAAAHGRPGRCEHRPLQGVRRGGGMWFPACPPARPSAVGADSISARVTLRRRGVARDDASIVPYRGCNNAGFEISRVAANPPLAVGADSISARGTLRRRGFCGAAAAFSQICRAGVHARRTTAISKWKRSCRRGARRDEGIPPYGRPGGCGQPFWPQRLPWFRRGGPWPSHKPCAAAGFPGAPRRTLCAPTQSPIQSLSSLTLASLPETNMQSPARNT